MNKSILICPFCRSRVTCLRRAICRMCGAHHHRACWLEQNGCSVFGCGCTSEERLYFRMPLAVLLVAPLLLALYLAIGSGIALMERTIPTKGPAEVAGSGMIWLHATLIGAGLFLLWIHDLNGKRFT